MPPTPFARFAAPYAHLPDRRLPCARPAVFRPFAVHGSIRWLHLRALLASGRHAQGRTTPSDALGCARAEDVNDDPPVKVRAVSSGPRLCPRAPHPHSHQFLEVPLAHFMRPLRVPGEEDIERFVLPGLGVEGGGDGEDVGAVTGDDGAGGDEEWTDDEGEGKGGADGARWRPGSRATSADAVASAIVRRLTAKQAHGAAGSAAHAGDEEAAEALGAMDVVTRMRVMRSAMQELGTWGPRGVGGGGLR